MGGDRVARDSRCGVELQGEGAEKYTFVRGCDGRTGGTGTVVPKEMLRRMGQGVEKNANNTNHPPEKKTKPKGVKNFSSLHAEAYIKIQKKVHTQRKEDTTGKDWDEVIRAKASGRDKNKANGNSNSGKAKKQKVVIPILDDPTWKVVEL